MTQTLKFENWKSGRRLVIRNEKGQLIASRTQKGSGIKTKEQAKKIFKKTGTFYIDRTRISRNFSRLENKKIKKVTFAGKSKTKQISTTNKGFRSITQIGKDTVLIRSKKPIRNEKHAQKVVELKIEGKVYYVYSDLNGSEKEKNKQAFLRARSDAIANGVINYDWSIQPTGTDKGAFVSPRGQQVPFTYTVEVQTFVKSEGFFETKI